jgi:hypothetical protein
MLVLAFSLGIGIGRAFVPKPDIQNIELLAFYYGKEGGRIMFSPDEDTASAIQGCQDLKRADEIVAKHPEYGYEPKYINTHMEEPREFCENINSLLNPNTDSAGGNNSGSSGVEPRSH